MIPSKHLRLFIVANILLLLLPPSIGDRYGRAAAGLSPFQDKNKSGTASYTVFLPVVSQSGSSTGSLSNGGVYIGEGGVGLGALANSLSETISLSITQTTIPTQTMPAQAQALSSYYQIGTGSPITLTTDSPLILAFPVPAAANTANLALAVLHHGPGVNDSDSSAPAWTLLEGRYDPGKKLFLTTLASLDQAGETITLVDQPGITSPSVAGQAIPDQSAQPQFKQFIVECLYFSNPADCTSDMEVTVEGYLSDIYDHIQGDLKFHEPRLRFLDETLTFDPNSQSSLGYMAYIEPFDTGECAAAHAGGYYNPEEGRLVLCLNPALGLDPTAVHTVIHEYFHATQYGYPNVLKDRVNRQDEPWIIEGMAMSAEESFFSTEMLRSTVGGWIDLHKVDVPMTSQKYYYEYFAQDFWVYAGDYLGLALSYLDAVLTYGARTQDVVTVLGNGNYLDIYWDYVTNQAEEPDITQSGASGSPCFLYQQVVNSTVDFNYDFYNHPYQILNTLDPLTSVVVQVNWDFNYTGADGAAMPTDPNDALARAALRFKLYQDGESGCESIPDGRRTFMNIDKNKKYYVVISNVDPLAAHNYLVGFETWPVPPAP